MGVPLQQRSFFRTSFPGFHVRAHPCLIFAKGVDFVLTRTEFGLKMSTDSLLIQHLTDRLQPGGHEALVFDEKRDLLIIEVVNFLLSIVGMALGDDKVFRCARLS